VLYAIFVLDLKLVKWDSTETTAHVERHPAPAAAAMSLSAPAA
jgi:hypothetical protein